MNNNMNNGMNMNNNGYNPGVPVPPSMNNPVPPAYSAQNYSTPVPPVPPTMAQDSGVPASFAAPTSTVIQATATMTSPLEQTAPESIAKTIMPNLFAGQNNENVGANAVPASFAAPVAPNRVVQPTMSYTPMESQPTTGNVNPAMENMVPPTPVPPTIEAAPTIAEEVPVETQEVVEIKQQAEGQAAEMGEVQSSVVEDASDDPDAKDVTFDYNALYGIGSKDIKDIEPTVVEEKKKPIFTTQDIVINNRINNGGNVPSFDANALDSHADSKKADSVLDDKQQDKADTRRRILFIGVLTILIVVFLLWIFPLIAGYKM